MEINEFKSVVLPLKNKLFRYAYKLLGGNEEAQDTVQDAFVKIWSAATLVQLNSIEAYAMTITRNLCIDKLRKRKNTFVPLNEDIAQARTISPDSILEQMDSALFVKNAIECLPELQKSIIHLRDIEGYEFEEIEKITGLTRNAIKVNLSRARKKIRESIQKESAYANR